MTKTVTESTVKAKQRQHKNGEVGDKDTKERGSGGDKLVIINGTPFGSFKKKIAMICMALPSGAFMLSTWLESDGSLMYVNTLWVTGVITGLGLLILLNARME